MRVLIALDATPPCRRLVEVVVERLWPSGSRFFLLHVLDPLRFVKAPISLQRVKDAAHAELENLKKMLIDAGWKTETDVLLGHPRSTIGEKAR
jgi:nucleotide-binding universal stress UspA family protein